MSLAVAAKPPEEPDKEPKPGSVRSSLKDRIGKAKVKRFTDVSIPGMEPETMVRFRAFTIDELEAIRKPLKKLPDDIAGRKGAAAIVSLACLGIFEDLDGKYVSLDPDQQKTCYIDDANQIVGEPILFDARLAKLLEREDLVTDDGRVGDVKALLDAFYPLDTDVFGACEQVMKLSGFGPNAEEDVEEMVRGNSSGP